MRGRASGGPTAPTRPARRRVPRSSRDGPLAARRVVAGQVELPENVQTLGDHLRGAGYRSTLIGKAHFQPLASRRRIRHRWNASRSCATWFLAGIQDVMRPGTASTMWNWARCTPTSPMSGSTTLCGWRKRDDRSGGIIFQQVGTGHEGEAQRQHQWDLPARVPLLPPGRPNGPAPVIAGEPGASAPFLTCGVSFHDPHPPSLVPRPGREMYDPEDMELGTLLSGTKSNGCRNISRLTPEPASRLFAPRPRSGYPNHGFHSHLCVDARGAAPDMAIYYGMASFMDQQIGRILDSLDESAASRKIPWSSSPATTGIISGQHG